jgi:3-oxoacyl-[acyl-carrier-protein] synthase II
LAGEGAAVVVIEREDDAEARGAHVLARIAASGAAFDATAPVSDWGDGDAHLAHALSRALDRAGIGIASLDRVVSGASGARRGDRLEAATLAALWDRLPIPPVLTPKAVLGEYGGGLLAAAVAALAGVPFGRVPSFETKDVSLAIAPHDGRELPAPRRVLVSALAAGGAAAWTVLERP